VGLLGLDLREGTTLAHAKEIAHYLNTHVRFLTLT
jgi:hypothetical protein